LGDRIQLDGFDRIDVPEGEDYAANCIRVNDYLLFAAGFPKVHNKLARLGYKIIELDMSEFQKMDGGLSCLSLRF
jgi:dimethylargininase